MDGKLHPRRSSVQKSISIFLTLFLLVAGLAGCDNRAEGKKLAEAGAATADTLAKYYDSLAQDTIDIWELEAFNSSIRGVSFDDREQQLLQDQLDALNMRARLARRLGSTYSALIELSSYNASGEVKESAENLSKAITAIPPLKASGVEPSAVFGMVAEDIMKWKQSKDIRKGSELILTTLEKIKILFDKESDAYKSIAEERGNKIESVIDHLIRNKMVLALPLLQKVPDTLSLKLVGADKPVENAETVAGLIIMARVRTRRFALNSAGAADGTQQAIEQLASNHREFRNKGGLSLAAVLSGLERAQSYLDEVEKLRSGDNK